uniref:Uncharacterized protein n=1 Tax=Anguilla anguilla TaxID=7936 RepID=A0A0E9XCV5_ANGAN
MLRVPMPHKNSCIFTWVSPFFPGKVHRACPIVCNVLKDRSQTPVLGSQSIC